MSIIEKIARRRLSSLMFSEDRVAEYVNYNNATTFLILYQSDMMEKNDEIKEIVRRLQADGKKVSTVGYVNKKTSITASLENTIMLDKSQVNVMGKPDRARVDHVLEQFFDVVLDLSLEAVIPLQYVLMWSQARLKCGALDPDEKQLDFMIELHTPEILVVDDGAPQPVADELYLFEQILFYLKTIKSSSAVANS